jgi:23S rRNA (cytidine1920-2'-O)/16S rRNA (cytidine1409-2'-O)-methyltransferase
MKRRIDLLLVDRGLAESRHQAQALLLAGNILVKEQKVEKPGQLVDQNAEIRVLRRMPFASRAGAKLQAALDHFHLSIAGRVCADLGASTGGFTDCLLQNGACRVYAFDVGKGQLNWRLQHDSRVIVRDEFNVRALRPADLPEDVSFVSMDLSFISATKILPSLKDSLVHSKLETDDTSAGPAIDEADIVVLVKPQFEVGKGEVGKGGIVRDPMKRIRALEAVAEFAGRNGFQVVGSIPSPVTGAGGNQEFLLYLQLKKRLLFSQ